MIIVSYDGDQKRLFVSERNHPVFGTFGISYSKEEFESMAGVDVTNFEKIQYEPYQGYLVKKWGDQFATPYGDPAEHPALNWILVHEDQLKNQARASYADDMGYVDDGSGNYVPKESLYSLAEMRNHRINQVRQVAFGHVAAIIMLSKINDLANLGIGTQVTARLNSIRDWKNEQEAIINNLTTIADLQDYEIPSFDAQAESDVNYVMGLL